MISRMKIDKVERIEIIVPFLSVVYNCNRFFFFYSIESIERSIARIMKNEWWKNLKRKFKKKKKRKRGIRLTIFIFSIINKNRAIFRFLNLSSSCIIKIWNGITRKFFVRLFFFYLHFSFFFLFSFFQFLKNLMQMLIVFLEIFFCKQLFHSWIFSPFTNW